MYPVFTASQHIHLSSYLIWMSLTFCIGVYYFYRRSFKTSLSAKIASELAIWIILGGFVGARALHIIAEYPQYYLDHPSEILKFWKGGFVFYGGLLGGLISAFIFLRRKHQIFSKWLDHSAPVIAFGYAFGRLGCLWAGCCFGKECTLPWAIVFRSGVEAPSGIPIHPTQIYASLAELLIWLVLLNLEKLKSITSNSGQLFYVWMILHGTSRIFVEQFRGDFRGIEYGGFYISTYISLTIVLSGFILYLSTVKKINSRI